MDNTFYTVGEVAALIGIHPETVRTYLRDGKLHGVKIGHDWRIPKATLDALIAPKE